MVYGWRWGGVYRETGISWPGVGLAGRVYVVHYLGDKKRENDSLARKIQASGSLMMLIINDLFLSVFSIYSGRKLSWRPEDFTEDNHVQLLEKRTQYAQL